MKHDFSVHISQDLMTNLDVISIALGENEQWTTEKIVQTVLELQFKDGTWNQFDERQAEKPYDNRSERLFSCQAFGDELVAIMTMRPDNSNFEFIAYTSKTALDKKKKFEAEIKQVIEEEQAKLAASSVP